MRSELRLTDDGSSTLYNQNLDEHYHSTFGAVRESEHIFINAGLGYCRNNHLKIFEAGFGTGLNAWLTLLRSAVTGQKIYYVGVEKFPVEEATWNKLNFTAHLNLPGDESFGQMHAAPWNQDVHLTNTFTLHKHQGDLLEVFNPGLPQFDLVYFDAFSPEKQPELWSEELFGKLCSHMNPGAILVTYCAKGRIRRTLQSFGLQVERIEGPPGKREMIRAQVPPMFDK